jgi:hypothetical protein
LCTVGWLNGWLAARNQRTDHSAAEEQLRSALEQKKKAERLSVAKSLKSQIRLREKELERERLEAMILSEPDFPMTERSMMSTCEPRCSLCRVNPWVISGIDWQQKRVRLLAHVNVAGRSKSNLR